MEVNAQRETSGKAIASLAFGVVSFFALPFLGGLLAIMLGSSAKIELREHPDLLGDGYATAGIILGVANLVCSFLAGLLMVLAFGVSGEHITIRF